jgi:hypothetical protein
MTVPLWHARGDFCETCSCFYICSCSTSNIAHREALTKIFSGQAGGPLAGLAPIITNFLCVETRPIHFEKQGLRRSVSIPSRLDCVVEGFANPPAQFVSESEVHRPGIVRVLLANGWRPDDGRPFSLRLRTFRAPSVIGDRAHRLSQSRMLPRIGMSSNLDRHARYTGPPTGDTLC